MIMSVLPFSTQVLTIIGMHVLSCRTWAPVCQTRPTPINPPKAAGDSCPNFILLSNNSDFAVNTSVDKGSYQFL